MVETHRLCLQHRFETGPLRRQASVEVGMTSPKIRCEHFNQNQGIALSDGCHRSGEESCTVIAQVVASNGSQHHIAQPHLDDRISDLLGFVGIESHGGLAFVHLAKGTTARADRPTEKEGGCTRCVALTSVGATAFFADCVQATLLHQVLHRFQLGDVADGATQPVG